MNSRELLNALSVAELFKRYDKALLYIERKTRECSRT